MTMVLPRKTKAEHLRDTTEAAFEAINNLLRSLDEYIEESRQAEKEDDDDGA